MSPEDIKLAASKIADAERLDAMLGDLEANEPFSFGVKGVWLNVTEGRALRQALIDYVRDAATQVKADIARLTAEQPKPCTADDMDDALAKLDDEARPNGGP